MRWRIIVLLIIASMGCLHAGAQDSLQATIVLIGDAGQLTDGKQPVVDAVRKNIPLTEKTTVVYLGDNLYKKGLPDDAMPTYDIAKAPLDSQITIARGTPSKVFFIPGNHDWANGASIGYKSILRVQSYIDLLGNENVQQYPQNGCPGPVEKKINDEITLVMMDSQWWLQLEDKPGIESDCDTKTKAEILTKLDDILSQNSGKLVILATHHPFKSYGPHGGYYTLKQHIFPFTDIKPNLYIPLPVLGSVYPLTRAVFGTIQDLKHPLYQDMIKRVTTIVKGHSNVIFVSGHEHTLQIIQDSSFTYIVSGSGSKTNRVSKGKNSIYAAAENGFVTLEISKNKNVTANAFTVNDEGTKKAFTKNILNFSTIPKPEGQDTLRQVDFTFKDSVVISASDQYKSPSGFRKFFLGSNYRKEWGMPVEMKVFNIRTAKGGLTVKSLGGGKQTKSLKLVDKNGHEWALRSIDKDPEKALPANLRGSIAQGILQDMISASHPYAPLVVPTLAKAVDVVTADPELYFIPDDPALGIYRKTFANTVAFLEDRDPTADRTDTKSTNTVINKLWDDNDNHVIQKEVLKARVLDMLIGDFDRHPDQWKWGIEDTGKGKLYFPIPRDRDQAFFNSDGFFVKIVSYFAIPYLHGFKTDFHKINRFNEVAKNFDRVFLNQLDERDWTEVLDNFQQKMTDEVIINAVKKLPAKIFATDSAVLVNKLISRRGEIKKEGLKFYRFLSREVAVSGSNKKEYFHIENDNDLLKLSIYKKNTENDSVKLMYRRVLDPAVTKELQLYGLNGEDEFKIDSDVGSRMKIRIIGGKGEDTFRLDGKVRKYLYDLNTEKNDLALLKHTKKRLSSDPEVLDYLQSEYKYDRFIFPTIKLGYNAEDKFLAGIGFTSIKHGFRKDPYKSEQRFSSLFAPTRKAYQLSYQGIFNQVIRKNDLILKANFVSPTLNNFFGYGNESTFDKNLPLEFYRVRYKYFEADALIRKRVKSVAEIAIGPTFYHYGSEFEDNKERIIANNAIFDSASIFRPKQYAGGKLQFNVNYLDNQLFPKRGLVWKNELKMSGGLSDGTRNLFAYTSDMSVYANVTGDSKVTFVLHAGGGRIFSKNPEYFQLLSLGANNFVRGYRKNRFSGQSLLYTGTELRYKLFNSKSYVLPGEVGLMGFYDVGRVWYAGENSQKWHGAYGGGLYFAPFNLVLISATVGVSPEEQLINFTVGSKFNLTF